MRVALITHPSSLDHRGPPQHPERPDRIGAVVAGVEQSSLTVVRITADPVDRKSLARVHQESFIDALEAFCAEGGGALDSDTFAVEASWDAALNAAGAGATAARALQANAADVGFVAMRPPGHHAERTRAMGFCLFNNVAVTAAELVESGGRVAIVDWDVHHGNGTQHAFSADPRVLYVSMHQHPFYPGTGWLDEIGEGDAAGTTVNLPMPRGSGGDTYAEALTRVVLPVVEQFEPEWLLVSAGYDAHRLDPLAELDLVEADYSLMASALAPLFPDQRAIYFLEGGYDLDAMRDSVTATLNGHAGLRIESKTAPEGVNPAGPFIDQIVETLSPYWDLG